MWGGCNICAIEEMIGSGDTWLQYITKELTITINTLCYFRIKFPCRALGNGDGIVCVIEERTIFWGFLVTNLYFILCGALPND